MDRKRTVLKRTAVMLAAAVFLLCACGIRPGNRTENAAETQVSTEETAAEIRTETAAETEKETQAETETETETETAAETQTESAAETEVETETETETETDMEEAFYIRELDQELMDRIRGRSYKDDCTVPVEDLRYLHVLHRDLEGNVHEGEMICNKRIAVDLLEILRELYENDYPIEKIRLVDEYDAVDEASMADNNSSCFNFRFVSYSNHISKHGYGLAVDINPLYNPYTKMVNGERSVEPANGVPYLDREKEFPYKITRDDLCCRLFLEHGFNWGGDWENSKDYQHFEMPASVVKSLYPD